MNVMTERHFRVKVCTKELQRRSGSPPFANIHAKEAIEAVHRTAHEGARRIRLNTGSVTRGGKGNVAAESKR
uniref:Uncharacterized protein n=1 Tax=Hyaloperonospora arabidopsidis (strain Emoy2) TaxID=559515 RepID=M4BPR7_HYAAE